MINKKKLIVMCAISATAIATGVIVATSTKHNYVKGQAEECSHTQVKHYAEVAPTMYKSGTAEYWVCCECHKSFKDSGLTQVFANTSGSPTSPSDGRYLAPLGEPLENGFRGANSVLSAEPAPDGYAFTKVYKLENGNIRDQFDVNASIYGLTKVAFAAKTSTKYFASHGDWLFAPTYWYIFELTNTGIDTWNMNVYTAMSGALKTSYASLSGNNLNSLLTFTCENDTSYVTNLRVLRDSKVGIAEAAVANSELVENMGSAALQFEQVSVKTLSSATQGQAFVDNPILDGVSYAEFAFLTKHRPLCDSSWGIALDTNTWYIAKFTVASENNVTCSVCQLDGTVKFNYSNCSSFANALKYYHYDGDLEDMDFYSTEIKAVVNKTITTTKIDECAFSSNGVSMTPVMVNAPHGFEKVSHWRNDTAGSLNGVCYSTLDLSSYATVTFAARTTGYYLLNGWTKYVSNKSWIVFTLTNNGDHTWDLDVRYLDGTLVVNVENMSDVKEGDAQFANHALNTILKANQGGYEPAKNDAASSFEVWATELRATLN